MKLKLKEIISIIIIFFKPELSVRRAEDLPLAAVEKMNW